MNLYTHEYEELNTKLRQMDAEFDEDLLVTILMSSFRGPKGRPYRHLITSLESRDTLTWRVATARLNQEYQSIQRNETSQVLSETDSTRALSAQNITCFYCNEKGHKKYQCPKWKRETGRENGRRGRGNSRWSYKRGQSSRGNGAYSARTVRPFERTRKESSYALLDSGATSHMVQDVNLLHRKCEDNRTITTAAKTVLQSKNVGTMRIRMGDGMPMIHLQNTLHVPGISENLMSVSALCDAGMNVFFNGDVCEITKNDEVIGKGSRQGNVYIVPMSDEDESAATATSGKTTLDIWHYRLAHADKKAIKRPVSYTHLTLPTTSRV